MRAALLSLALALPFFLPAKADADWFHYRPAPVTYYTPYYTPYYVAPSYYPTTTFYSVPVTGYYGAPYYWSGRYFTTPNYGGWTYQQYYPYTNQYYYQYRVAPWGF